MSRFVNNLHRSTVIVLLLVMFLASICILGAVVSDAVGPSDSITGSRALNGAIGAAADGFRTAFVTHRVVLMGVSAAVALFSGLLFWIELRAAVRSTPKLVLRSGELGDVVIALNQISVLAQHETEDVDGVREVRTMSHVHKAGLLVEQLVSVEANKQIPLIAAEIQRRVKESLEYHLGFPVAKVSVALQRSSLSRVLR